MKAIVKFAPGPDGIACKNVPVPETADGWILLKTIASGICGTDLHIVEDEYPCNMPVILGHEYVGVVSAVGKGVTDFMPGDTVVSLACVSTCGICEYCQEGLYMLCPERKSIGSGINGAMAEYIAVPAARAFRIDGKPKLEYALFEPLACCIRAVSEIAQVQPGSRVCISGPGIMGQLVAQVAKHCGAEVTIVGISGDEERLALAKTVCADTCILAQQLHGQIDCGAHPHFDFVFECAGVEASLKNCIDFCKKNGTLVQVGLFSHPIHLDMNALLYKELSYRTSYGSNPSTWIKMLSMHTQDPFILSPYISGIYNLDSYADAFSAAKSRDSYKILFSSSESK